MGRGSKGDFDEEIKLQKPHRIEFTSEVTLRELLISVSKVGRNKMISAEQNPP